MGRVDRARCRVAGVNVLGLFSGIGGFELGFSRAGFDIAAMCEIEPYCRAVLAKRFPGVPVYGDVRGVTAGRLWIDGIDVDVITGGFPCQDISLAGKGAGLGGERSGLWFEFERVIQEVRPRYAVIENVGALRSRGLDRILGTLAALGYDAEWHCIPASAVGAPHRRDRVWIVAYAEVNGRGSRRESDAAQEPGGRESDRGGERTDISDPNGESTRWFAEPRRQRSQWEFEPDVGRVANGIPARVDRLRALGNAVVPQITEIIARCLLRLEQFTAGNVSRPD